MRNYELEHLWDTLEYLGSLDPWSEFAHTRHGWHDRSVAECSQRTAGHDDYGIVHDPCVVHLKKYESVAMWLWQEGNDWKC
jgi:hypothetical protein